MKVVRNLTKGEVKESDLAKELNSSKIRKGVYFKKLPLTLQLAVRKEFTREPIWVPRYIFREMLHKYEEGPVRELLQGPYADLAYGHLSVLTNLGD